MLDEPQTRRLESEHGWGNSPKKKFLKRLRNRTPIMPLLAEKKSIPFIIADWLIHNEPLPSQDNWIWSNRERGQAVHHRKVRSDILAYAASHTASHNADSTGNAPTK